MSLDIDKAEIEDVESFPEDIIDEQNVDINESLEDISGDVEKIPASSYTFKWDGTPTHCIEWDEASDPSPKVKKLTR